MGRNRQCQDGTCLEISGDLQLVLQDRHAMALEVDHVKEAIDRREDQLPDRELREHLRTNPAGQGMMVEPRDEQQRLVEVEEVENPFH